MIRAMRLIFGKMSQKELLNNIEKALSEIRPYLLTDGGDISFVSVENDVVNVKFHGACIGCNVNQMTLRNGVEATIQKYAPQIKRVVEVK
jgi:Fe-S cluster biogenesis protein NfuA